jgi:HD-GYP domain-containing protein (c-di-GMP phosphodiesterase class II)
VSYLLLHHDGWSPATIAPALAAARVETRSIWDQRDLVCDEQRPTVFLLDAASRERFASDALRRFVDAGGAIVVLGRAGEEDVPEGLPAELLTGFVPHPVRPRQLLVAIRAGYRETAARVEMERRRREAQTRAHEIDELTRIGMMLGTERDPEALLEEILKQARRLTQSDAGSLFLIKTKRELRVEEEAAKGIVATELEAREDDDEKVLLFRLAQNDTLPGIPFKKQLLPLDRTSLAGYTAVTGAALNIEDVYCLPPDAEYKFQRSFDDRVGYRTKSMLVVSMKDHKDQMIGVLQLINRKRDPAASLATPADVAREVIRYSKRTQDLVSALAGQAAVSIENSYLLQEIERLFEGFVQAAVYAIEKRDEVTEGHSHRVARGTVGLAKIVDGVTKGPYRDLRFSRLQIRELHYAGLLHDFGKVGVPENVLKKKEKLPKGIEVIQQRHALLVRTAERTFWRRQADFLQRHGPGEDFGRFLSKLETAHAEELADLERFLQIVIEANKPTVQSSEVSNEISEYAKRTYESVSGEPLPLLTQEEVGFLRIPRGNLNAEEWEEIKNHVTHTYWFLRKIPWTRELVRVPEIAWGHHEKLNGAGYPRQLHAAAISPETRMMTISDIYDALTAKDRSYKPKVNRENALDIMTKEFVQVGQLDQELFRLFVEAKVFKLFEETVNTPD